MHRTLSVLVAALVFATAPAFAGIADSPIPAPFTNHIFSVPGVINAGGLSTSFACTSTSTSAIQVGIELFSAAGGAPLNSAAATAVTLSSGATVLIGTNASTGLSVDQNLSAQRSRRARDAARGGRFAFTSTAAASACAAATTSIGRVLVPSSPKTSAYLADATRRAIATPGTVTLPAALLAP
jgi:hypothetical protein